jgi:hypothetical protein
MSSDEKFEIEYDRSIDDAETDLAWLIVIDGEEYWMPKSKCDIDETNKSISVPRWLIEKKGLDIYV